VIELLIVGGPLIVGGIISNIVSRDSEPSRLTYGLTTAWWKGAFVPDNPAITLSKMLDADANCELWESNQWDEIWSDNLGVRIEIPYRWRARIHLKKKDGRTQTLESSAYDDYVLSKAMNRWDKRSKRVKKMKAELDSQREIDDRITRNYIDTIEKVEKRILNSDAPVANELSEMLLAPHKKDETVPVPKASKRAKMYVERKVA
jgi:hypothetical protein